MKYTTYQYIQPFVVVIWVQMIFDALQKVSSSYRIKKYRYDLQHIYIYIAMGLRSLNWIQSHVTTYWCYLSPDACILGHCPRLVIIIVMQKLSLEPITIVVTAPVKPVRNIDRPFTILTTGHFAASRYERIISLFTVEFRPNTMTFKLLYMYVYRPI